VTGARPKDARTGWLVVDLGMPRDVAPQVREHARLADLFDLRTLARENAGRLAATVARIFCRQASSSTSAQTRKKRSKSRGNPRASGSAERVRIQPKIPEASSMRRSLGAEPTRSPTPTVKVEARGASLRRGAIREVGLLLLFVPIPLLNGVVLPGGPYHTFAGLGVQVLGAWFDLHAKGHLGRPWSSSISIKTGHRLITSGPCRFIRHPMYTAMIAMAPGTALVSAPRRDRRRVGGRLLRDQDRRRGGVAARAVSRPARRMAPPLVEAPPSALLME
jgi:hypothetical protein